MGHGELVDSFEIPRVKLLLGCTLAVKGDISEGTESFEH